MATTNDSNVSSSTQVYPRPYLRLQPISCNVPPSIDRQFERYLINHHHQHHHHFPKLPAIAKSTSSHNLDLNQSFRSYQSLLSQSVSSQSNDGRIHRLFDNENYRRAQARLIEYRRQSLIPGVALAHEPVHSQDEIHQDSTLPSKEAIIEATRTKQLTDEIDFDDDESILSHETDRRRRAKHWIRDHQFFFTEYQ